MKTLLKEEYENDTISNPGSIERLEHSESFIEDTDCKVDRWKMQSPQSCKEQEVEEICSDGDSDEITFLCSKTAEDPLDTAEDPLDTKENFTKPEKDLNSRKRKLKGKISYDENFTDESDDDNLHLHLDSESDLDNRTSNVKKRKKYKESSDTSHFSSDSDVEIVTKKINKDKNAAIVNLSGKRPLTNSVKEPVKKLKSNNSQILNTKETDEDIHLKEFWEKTDVAEIFLSVKNEDMTIQTASEILGYSYLYTNHRYKEILSNKTGTYDEGELNKPWFICKRHVQQYLNSSSEEPGKCSDNKRPGKCSDNKSSKTSYKNGNKLSNTSKSEYMNIICSLPGWKRQEKVRQVGSTAGQTDVYYISPSGKKLRSIPSLIRYCNDKGIDINLSNFDFRRSNRKNKKPRKKIKYKFSDSDSELSQPVSIQTKTPEEKRINDNLLLTRYNIKKCIRIILEDCMTSKSLSQEIKKESLPHVNNGVKEIDSKSSQEENVSLKNENSNNIKSGAPSFEDVYDTFQLTDEKNDLISKGKEKALEKNESEINKYESQNATKSSDAEENVSGSKGFEIKTEDQAESQNTTKSSDTEEKASGSKGFEIKTEERPESQNATKLSDAEEKASSSKAFEIKTEDQPELRRLQSSSSEYYKASEAHQMDEESNSDSGSQSDGGNSSEREQKLLIAFALDNFPCQEQLHVLAKELGMRQARLKRWFMNQRIAHMEYMSLRERDVIDKRMLNYKKHHLPYRCKECKAAFICLKDCRNHKKEHHWTNEDYTCKHCDKKFSSTAEYEEHKQNGQCKPKFTILDVVWAKFSVYPWWPAIVCKHPNIGAYLRRNQIHVQFFDKPVSRGWVDDTNIKAFGPVGKCGIPLCSDKKWVTAVIDAQRAVMMPKMSRSKLLVTMTPEDDESDWKPEGEIRSSERSSENDYITERTFNIKIKKSDSTEGSKSFYRSKKKKNYQNESSDSGSSSSDPDYYKQRKKHGLKKKYLKKIRKREKECEKIKYDNAKSIERISRRKKMILDEHFTHNHMIPGDVQDDLAKELKLSQATVTQYLRAFRTEIFTKVKVNNEERGVFSCNMCPVKYLAKSSLKNHMKRHLPNKGIKCSDCSTAFEHPSVYYHHLRFKGHNASREVDEYLKKLSEHAISVKDIIRDLDYIFTDEYNENCSKLDLNKIIEKVYELKCQPGEECQCDKDFSDYVPRYIQDMFQGMESKDDFIIVDDDDLIYMGKGYEDELVPMIIKNGAEMLAATDIPYKKFFYKFKPPTDLAQDKGPPKISRPSVPSETYPEPKPRAEKIMSQIPTETATQRVPSETITQMLPTEPTIPRVPSETISQAVPTEPTIPIVSVGTIPSEVTTETTIPEVGPETIKYRIVPCETIIPKISTDNNKAILPNKTTLIFPTKTNIPTVPTEIIKPEVVPVESTTLLVPSETSKPILPNNSTTTIPTYSNIRTLTSKTTKPAFVLSRNNPVVLNKTITQAVPSDTTGIVSPVKSTKLTKIPDIAIPTVTFQTTKPELIPDEMGKPILPTNISKAPSEKTTSKVPTNTAIPVVSTETMSIVPAETTISTVTNMLSEQAREAEEINKIYKSLITSTTTVTDSINYLQHATGNSSIPAQSHNRS